MANDFKIILKRKDTMATRIFPYGVSVEKNAISEPPGFVDIRYYEDADHTGAVQTMNYLPLSINDIYIVPNM
jgi:hypothetical protein